MNTQAISSFGRSAVDYLQSSRLYKEMRRAGKALQGHIEKVADVVLPRNPVTQHREFRFLPTWVENRLGVAYYDDVCPRYKISDALGFTKRVSHVFERLVDKCARKDELQFELRVMQDDNTVNAFCLPGGKVVITTAMIRKLQEEESLPETALANVEDGELRYLTFEDKLAAVLGHEISHACAGHGRRSLQLKLISFLAIKLTAATLGHFILQKEERAIQAEKRSREEDGKRMSFNEERTLLDNAQAKSKLISTFFEGISNVIKFFAMRSYSRCHELEADKYSMKIAQKAGYKPAAAIWLQHKFLEMRGERKVENKSLFMRLFSKSLDLFSTHPPSLERLEANRMTLQNMRNWGVEAIYPGS